MAASRLTRWRLPTLSQPSLTTWNSPAPGSASFGEDRPAPNTSLKSPSALTIAIRAAAPPYPLNG